MVGGICESQDWKEKQMEDMGSRLGRSKPQDAMYNIWPTLIKF